MLDSHSDTSSDHYSYGSSRRKPILTKRDYFGIQYGQNRFPTADTLIIGKLSQENNLIKIE